LVHQGPTASLDGEAVQGSMVKELLGAGTGVAVNFPVLTAQMRAA